MRAPVHYRNLTEILAFNPQEFYQPLVIIRVANTALFIKPQQTPDSIRTAQADLKPNSQRRLQEHTANQADIQNS
jgi:hypothetical protein